jgi:hypothetical protein
MSYRRVKSAVALVVSATAGYLLALRGLPSDPRPADAHQVELAPSEQATHRTGTAENTASEGAPDILALRRALLERMLSAPPAPSTHAPVDPVAEVRQTLDARMASAPANPEVSARMAEPLREVIESGLLGEAEATLACGATICKVDLTGSDESVVEKAISAFDGRASKAFASMTAYPNGVGNRALYFAKNAADLWIGPPPAQPTEFVATTAIADTK